MDFLSMGTNEKALYSWPETTSVEPSTTQVTLENVGVPAPSWTIL